MDTNGLRRFIYSIVLSMRTMLRHKCQTLFVNWTHKTICVPVCVCVRATWGAWVCIVFFKYLLAIIQCSMASLNSGSVENSSNMHHYTFYALKYEHLADFYISLRHSKPTTIRVFLADKYPLTAFDFDIGLCSDLFACQPDFPSLCVAN